MRSNDIEKILTRKDLSRLLEVSPTTVDAWVDRGCPVFEKKGSGHLSSYEVAKIVRWAVRTHYGLMCG